MLSRRSVRIKAMQLLFSVNRDKQLEMEEARKRYWQSIEDTFHLYILNLYAIIQITKVSLLDAEKRRSKHLPTDLDKAFKPKLYNNPLIKNLEQNQVLKKYLNKLNFSASHASDYFDSIYYEFTKTEALENYLKKSSRREDHLDILLELYRFCRQNELYNEIMEDHYGTWYDDKSVVVGAVKKTLKALPAEDDNALMANYPSDETVNDFGFQLFEQTLKSDETLLEYIRPTLKNWDSERLAVIDMILLKMAICELLNFSSIPTKVTINEYVDIAKNYSTAKSKDFINGILDRIMKDFIAEGLIQKEGRGLQD